MSRKRSQRVEATMTAVPGESGWYRVDGVGQEPFWPHDGDYVDRHDIAYLRERKDWNITIIEEEDHEQS